MKNIQRKTRKINRRNKSTIRKTQKGGRAIDTKIKFYLGDDRKTKLKLHLWSGDLNSVLLKTGLMYKKETTKTITHHAGKMTHSETYHDYNTLNYKKLSKSKYARTPSEKPSTTDFFPKKGYHLFYSDLSAESNQGTGNFLIKQQQVIHMNDDSYTNFFDDEDNTVCETSSIVPEKKRDQYYYYFSVKGGIRLLHFFDSVEQDSQPKFKIHYQQHVHFYINDSIFSRSKKVVVCIITDTKEPPHPDTSGLKEFFQKIFQYMLPESSIKRSYNLETPEGLPNSQTRESLSTFFPSNQNVQENAYASYNPSPVYLEIGSKNNNNEAALLPPKP